MIDNDLNEVRRIRHEISQEFGHDVQRLAVHYQELEKQIKELGTFTFWEQPAGRDATQNSDPLGGERSRAALSRRAADK